MHQVKPSKRPETAGVSAAFSQAHDEKIIWLEMILLFDSDCINQESLINQSRKFDFT
jgi:hypothetical protein